MGRRIPRGAGWRLVAIITLVIALTATFPQGARAGVGVAMSVPGESFSLQPVPTDPVDPVIPTVLPMETAVPTEPATVPPVIEPTVAVTQPADETAVPVATTVPDAPVATSVVPSVEATVPVATDTPEGFARRPAYLAVRAIVCTSDDPEVIGTTVINPYDGLADDEDLLPECRAAREGEFTFVFRDLRMSSPWDDLTLGQRATNGDGIVLFDTVVTREGQSVLVFEQDRPNDFSTETTIPLIADGTVSMIAIVVTGQPEGDVTVRTVDSVSGQPVASACYELAAAGAADIPLAAACDADDGADGTVVFPAVANGDYVVVPETTPAGFVVTPSPLTVASQPVDLSLPAAPFGTLQLISRSCQAPPPGVLNPTPTPAPGDGIAGLGETVPGTVPSDVTGPTVVFSTVNGSAVNAAGTGLEGDAGMSGCVPTGASLTVTAPDGTVTAVAIGQDGVAAPVTLAPTIGDERYVIRDDVSGAETTVAVNPAGPTTVTAIVLPG